MADDPAAIARDATTIAAQLRRQLGALLGRHRLAQTLFIGPDGKPTRAALDWLAELGRSCFADRTTFDEDPRRHAFREGRRSVLLEIQASLRLDTARLATLTRELREEDDD